MLLADRLALFDQDVAAGVSVVDGRRRGCGPLSRSSAVASASNVKRRRAIQLIGDQIEQDLADARRGERRAEFLVDRPVGLDDPLGHDPIARHQAGGGARLARVRGSTAARLDSSLAWQRAGAENAIAEQAARTPGRSARAGCRAARAYRWPPSGRDSSRASASRLDRQVLAQVLEAVRPWRSAVVRSSRCSASSWIGPGSLTIDGRDT